MKIASNIASLFAQRQLGNNQFELNRTVQRLSSGLRVNSARDDAAGIAIADRMTAQVRGANQAQRNLNDAISMVQTAEGAIATVLDNLQRIRELAVQAGNATLSTSDKQALQAEANALLADLDRINRNTEFNGLTLFSQQNVSLGGERNKRAVLDGLKLGWIEAAETRIQRYYGIRGDDATLKVVFRVPDGQTIPGVPDDGGVAAAVGSLTGGADAATGRTTDPYLYIDMLDFIPPNLPDGGETPLYNDRIIAHEMVHAVMGRAMTFNSNTQSDMPNWFKEGSAELIHGADERVAADTANGTDTTALLTAFNADDVSASAGYSAGYVAMRYLHDKIKAAGGTGVKDVMVYLSEHNGATLSDALSNASSSAFADLSDFETRFGNDVASYVAAMDLSNDDTGAIGGLDADGDATLDAEAVLDDQGIQSGRTELDGADPSRDFFRTGGFKVTLDRIGGSSGLNFVSFQVGTNANQYIGAQFAGFSALNLGMDDVDLVSLAKFALAHADEAIDFVNRQRAEYGALMNRFSYGLSQLMVSAETTSAARSRIADTDYAAETAKLTRAKILQQASTALLAQANTQPRLALSLLRR